MDGLYKVAPDSFGREIAEGGAHQGEYRYDGGDPSIVQAKDVSKSAQLIWMLEAGDAFH